MPRVEALERVVSEELACSKECPLNRVWGYRLEQVAAYPSGQVVAYPSGQVVAYPSGLAWAYRLGWAMDQGSMREEPWEQKQVYRGPEQMAAALAQVTPVAHQERAVARVPGRVTPVAHWSEEAREKASQKGRNWT
jgi:hypothetical protein